ncbi:MAG TPA: hypothetical protein P5121_21590 [Caldilineaceae bacterium]|nr:hypothetical protein [Caldilineaceae bacterium]
MMLNKFDSPIVKVETRKFQTMHHGRRGSIFGECGDLVGIMLLCLTAYSLFLYYMMPETASHQYGRAAAELSYHWRQAWYAFEYHWYTAYLPYLNSLLYSVTELWPR